MRHWDDPIKPKLPKDPWTWESSWWYENWMPFLIMVIVFGGLMTFLFFCMFVWVPAGG